MPGTSKGTSKILNLLTRKKVSNCSALQGFLGVFFIAFRDISQTLLFYSFRVELSYFGCYDTIKFRIFYRRVPDADNIARFIGFFLLNKLKLY